MDVHVSFHFPLGRDVLNGPGDTIAVKARDELV